MAKPRAKQSATVELPRAALRRADALVPYPNNPRKHSDAHILEVMGSILEFGWTNPILADEFIRAGHARQKAALKIYQQGKSIRLPGGLVLPKGFVPVIDCTGWTEAQRRAYILADNKLTENAEWDKDLLGAELAALKDLGTDLSLIGFSDKEQQRLLPGGSDPGGGFRLDSAYQILIECADEAEQLRLLERLQADGIKNCRALIA